MIMWEKVRCISNRAYVVLRMKQPSGINIQVIKYVGHYIEGGLLWTSRGWSFITLNSFSMWPMKCPPWSPLRSWCTWISTWTCYSLWLYPLATLCNNLLQYLTLDLTPRFDVPYKVQQNPLLKGLYPRNEMIENLVMIVMCSPPFARDTFITCMHTYLYSTTRYLHFA